LSLSTSGMEAPLNAAILVWTTWLLVRPRNRTRWFCAIGLMTGLAYLTRTDNIFFVMAAFAVVGWEMRQKQNFRQNIILALSGTVLLILPWHLWNYLRFDQVLQGSASALPEVRKLFFFAQNPQASEMTLFGHRLELLGKWFPSIFWYTGLGTLWYLFFFAWGSVSVLQTQHKSPFAYHRMRSLLPLLVAVIFLGIAHKFFRLAAREWYYVTSDVCLALIWGVGIQMISEKIQKACPESSKQMAVLVLAELLLMASLLLPIPMLGQKLCHDWQECQTRPRAYPLEILDAFAKIPDISPGAMLGATDSGILGFFSPHPCINLDGVLNREAERAIRAGRLLDYMQNQGIRYAIITPRMLSARILGNDYASRLRQRNDLTPQGYEILPMK
jgi:hypothetical protein